MIREKLVYWICLLAMMAGTSLFAQRNITEITVDVTGLGNVTERYVQTNIRLKPGDVYLEGRTNEDVVALMKTGRFEDVQVATELVGEDGIKLTFKVRAFPLVTDVKLFLLRRQLGPEEPIGNPALADLMDAEYLAIKESKLLKKLQMIKGQQFNSARMHTDEKLLEEEYRKKGYYPIKVKGQLALYLDGVIAFLTVFFLKQFLISVHPGRVELLALDHLELFQEFAFFDGEIFRIHQVRQGRVSNRLLRTQLTPQQKQLHIRHQRKSPNLKSKFDSILAHQFRSHLHILETTCFHQCHHVLIGAAFQIYVTGLETYVGLHITLGHITEPRNVHGDLRDITLGEQ